MDFTSVYRSEATGSSIGTSFNSIPYSNGSTGQLSETKFSAQNSRVGLRIDSRGQRHQGAGLPGDGLPRQRPDEPLRDEQRGHAPHAQLLRRREERPLGAPRRPGLEPDDAQPHRDLSDSVGYLLHEQHGHELPDRPHLGAPAPDPAGLPCDGRAHLRPLARESRPVRGGLATLPSAFTATEVDTGAATTSRTSSPTSSERSPSTPRP